MNRISPPQRFQFYWPVVLSLLFLFVFACGKGGDTPVAAPTFCPAGFASRLQATPGVNSPPSAYYQSLSAGAETTIRVTLLACDPDHPSTSAGLTWSVIPDPASSPAGVPGPSHGTLSAMAGTYPAAIISYDPTPGFTGSDTFWYRVVDAHGATSNDARILVNVLPVPVSLVVSGPTSAVENTTITFTATAGWIGTSPSDVTSRARWTENSSYASFRSPGVLTIGEIPSDQTVTVTAAFSANGASVSDTFTVSVVNVDLTAGPILYIWDIGRIMSFDRSTGQVATLDGTVGWWSGAPILFSRGLVSYYAGNFYFSSKPASGGTNLWRIAPSGGAVQVSDISNLLGGMSPSDMVVYEGKLYLSGYDDTNALQLWSYDQADGLATLTEGGAPVWPLALTPIGGKLAFSGMDTQSNFQLRSYDTNTGFAFLTGESTSLDPIGTTVFGDRLCFNGADPSGGNELWCYDPAGGLTMLTDTAAGINPLEFEVLDGVLYFVGGETYPAMQLWAYDGASVPSVACSLAGGIWPVGMSALDGRLYFMGSGAGGYGQLFRYDPASPASGAVPVTSFATGFMITDGTRMVVHDGRLYFSGSGVSEGVPTLWSYNAQEGLVARRTDITWSLVDAMGLDPGQPPLMDLSGTWTIETTTGSNTCGDPVGVVSTSRAAITQRGGDVTVDDETVTWNAFMRTYTVQSRQRTYPDGGGFTTESFAVSGNPSGAYFHGLTTWTWTDGSFNCSGTCTLMGQKDVPGVAWSAPKEVGNLFSPLFAGAAPDLGMDGSGNATIVWADAADGDYLYATQYSAALETWSAPANRYHSGMYGLVDFAPKVGVDADGMVRVLFEGANFSIGSEVVMTLFYDGTSWSTASTVSGAQTPASTPHEGPSLDVTPGGRAAMAWKGDGFVRAAWSDPGPGLFSTVTVPLFNLDSPVFPTVSAYGESSAVLVFVDKDAVGGEYSIMEAHSTEGVWSSVNMLFFGSTTPIGGLAVDSGDGISGVRAAAWVDANGDTYAWVARNFPATQGTVYTLSTLGTNRYPQVAVDGAGTVTVAWDNGNGDVFVTRNASGFVWEDIARLNDWTVWAEHPALCVHRSGRTVVAWVQGRDDSTTQLFDVFSSVLVPGSAWSAPVGIQTAVDLEVVSPVRVQQSADGSAIAAWVTNNPSAADPKGRLWVSRRP